MQGEIEAAADVLTAGMVAREIEGESGHADEHHACANCETPVSGRFCSNCGQSAHLHRSILHLGEELLHGLLHFDAKGWRTLPLLVFRPGQLTRRYVDGQRTRFVSPLALFLFMVFLMFFVFSLTAGNVSVAGDASGSISQNGIEKAREKIAAKVQAKKERLIDAQKALAEAKAEGGNVERASERVTNAENDLNATQEALSMVGTELAKPEAGKEEKGGGLRVNTGIGLIDSAFKHATDNPELVMYKLKNAASKYSFLLVPISLPFVWLLFFWKRQFTMYDHAVFVLYSLCFMALLMSSAAVLGHFGFAVVAGILVVFAPPLHMYKQLRGTYGVSRIGGFVRTGLLLLVAAIVLSIYATTVIALSAQ